MALTDDLPAPGRLNYEPVFKWNCNTTEIAMIALVIFPLVLLIGLGLGFLLRHWEATLMFTVFGTPLAVWLGGLILGDIKRDRPEGYYQQKVMRLVSRSRGRFPQLNSLPGFRDLVLIEHTGSWDVTA